ncbi:MAG TPA: TfoX/Sxy family DNA transformation protein [Candidatus Saccharimonadales bacterium]|nr:TfoX/Sxy family DNA transformation protein [Candidatus Saccharimonadales bacterium]
MEQDTLDLRNIDSQTAEWLVGIGITTNKAFLKLGAEKTFKLLIEAGFEPSTDVLYALKGAEEDLDLDIIAKRERKRAKSRFADMDES